MDSRRSTTSPDAATVPNPGSNRIGARLNSVDCISQTYCVAVGFYADSSYNLQPLIEVDNSGTWMPSEGPVPPDSQSDTLSSATSVTCVGIGDCFASGYYWTNFDDQDESGMILTLSGDSWSVASAPLPESQTGNIADKGMSATSRADLANSSTGKVSLNGVSCSKDGTCTAVGTDRTAGLIESAHVRLPRPSPTPTPPVSGYDLVGSDGGVFAFGGAFHGSLPGLGVNVDDIAGIVPTTTGNGYFLVGSDGGVFAFNAPFANSLPGIGVHVSDIVGIVPTTNDQGYFLVGRDGGVFSLNAPFENSLPGLGIHVDDIVGIAATPNDRGYWLIGSNGAVYAFGDARSHGDAPAGAVGIAAAHDGGGYWIAGSNGVVTPFGDARTFGDLDSLGISNIVGITVSPDSRGYDLFGSDGGVFSFGDAAYKGSLPGLGVHLSDIVGAAST